MSTTDYRQVTAVLRRLGALLTWLNPVELVTLLSEVVREVAEPPPGDPDALDLLAAAYRQAAGTLGATGAAGRAPEAFERAADALADLAGTVRRQRWRHAELHRQLHAAWYDATHVGRMPMPDPSALGELVGAVRELVAGCVALYTESLAAADRAASRFADLAGQARAAAAVAGGLAPQTAVTLAGLTVGVPGIGDGYDDGILSLAQLRRAGRHTALAEPDRGAFTTLLDLAGTETERAWLYKALTAGHALPELRAFAERIRGREPAWLDAHLSLIDRGGTGSQNRLGVDVRQYEDTTCGTTSLIVTRAEADPVYALALTDGDFAANFAAERATVHDRTNVVWPERFGTSPAGMAAWLNAHAAALGTGYRWELVDDTDPRAISAVLRQVVTAADSGHPVPILLGGPVPRHYVLVIGHSGGDVLLYEPTGGRTVRVAEQDFLDGRLREPAGFDHVQAVVLPVDYLGQPVAAGNGLAGSK
ncbi:MAG: hypothetical protein ACJ72N_11800 [Labedaea sp.]